jgi:hypothetical protein
MRVEARIRAGACIGGRYGFVIAYVRQRSPLRGMGTPRSWLLRARRDSGAAMGPRGSSSIKAGALPVLGKPAANRPRGYPFRSGGLVFAGVLPPGAVDGGYRGDAAGS